MKKILINETPWQTRIAIIRDGTLQNIYFWSHTTKNLERSFFKGIVTKILPGIQTAFVDIGQERSGFLNISEIDREMAIQKISNSSQLEDIEEAAPRQEPVMPRQKPDISKILKENQHILVQVSKEPVNEKGAKLTTCYTLPGRFIVLMPNIGKIGISKKIESKEERQRLKDLLATNLPQGMGAIIRTTSEFQGASEILTDLSYLLQTWNALQKKYSNAQSVEQVHEDIDLALQTVRDHLDDDVESVITDSESNYNEIYKFVKTTAPEYAHKIKLYSGQATLFDQFDVENQIEEALQKKIMLKSGGSIVIEPTEAMTVVDVNTGKYIGKTNLEETLLKTNLEAAEEICRQLRLRNIGGLIVIDFIDMTNSSSKQKLYRFFEKHLKEKDKFQSVVLKITEFGLVQMTRKRSGKTLIQQLTQACQECCGTGVTKSISDDSYSILRDLSLELSKNKTKKNISIYLNPKIFEYITSTEYNAILYLEKMAKTKIELISKASINLRCYKIEFH